MSGGSVRAMVIIKIMIDDKLRRVGVQRVVPFQNLCVGRCRHHAGELRRDAKKLGEKLHARERHKEQDV
jgi:hypothetical protein